MNISYAIEIRTSNTPNGAQRHGWYVYASDGVLRGFLQAEGKGDYNLYHMYPGTVIKLHEFRVPVSEWRTAMKEKQLSMRYAGFEYGWDEDPDEKQFAWSYNRVRGVGLIWYGGQYAEVTVSGTWKPGRLYWDGFETLNMWSGDTGLPLIEWDPEQLTDYFIKSGQAG
jgi:hypothetical protein